MAKDNAKKESKPSRKRASDTPGDGPTGWLLRWAGRLFWGVLSFQAILVFLFAFVDPPANFYMWSEWRRLGEVKQDWREIEKISIHMPRAVVAAEDANFCAHYGFDLAAIKAVLLRDDGRLRGASTLSQQVAKNVFLWPGRSWLRKVLEAETTVFIELFWSKRRIVEVYLNVAEFDEGVFGVGAAAGHYFGVSAEKLTLLQSSRLAAILPNPKNRSASQPSNTVRKRTKSIMSGAETIAADGRNACFQS